MSTRILMVHYSPPGAVGGVEHIMEMHVVLLRERGYTVEVAAGSPSDLDIDVHVIPALNVASPDSERVEEELGAGVVSPHFEETVRSIEAQLRPLVAAVDYVIVHNAFTLHFSLPLTAALWRVLAEYLQANFIAWCHDLAWTNPLYLPAMHPGYPWDLLREPAPGVRYVAISETRKEELQRLWEERAVPIEVVPNGVDLGAFLRLSPDVLRLAQRFRLFEQDIVLLLPVRVTRRKNIELGIRTVRALVDRGYRTRYIISGPITPHHPGRALNYLSELKSLALQLGLTEEIVFLADELGANLPYSTVSELFALADALLLPSEQEGFGLPLLEAGLARLPCVVSSIPILREVGGSGVRLFSLDDSPETIAGIILDSMDAVPARLFKRVVQEYRWDAIFDKKIVPLLESTAGIGALPRAGVATGEDLEL